MSKLTLNELSNSLNDYINEKQNVEDYSLMTENKTIVGAINEIYGKEIIANAIGEPLNSSDTFTKMSNDINSLLSSFKTNMMNSGVTVESGDKFKQLIDKIKTISENSNNRFKFAEGKIDDFTFTMPGQNVAAPKTCDLNDLDFKPTYLFINIKTLGYIAMNQNNAALEADMNITISNLFNDENNYTLYRVPGSSGDFVRFSLSNITDKSCDILIARYIYQMSPEHYKNISWIAIGVGEEDTTLRDSLADILKSNGVDVSDEDNMADLIGKVDGIPKVTQVVASDNMLMTIQRGQSQRTFGYQDTIARFTCLFEGSIRAFVNARVNQSYTDIMYFELFRDGVIIETGWANVPAHTTIGSNLYYDFNDIKLGDEIQIRFKSTISTNVVYVLDPGLRGDIVK